MSTVQLTETLVLKTPGIVRVEVLVGGNGRDAEEGGLWDVLKRVKKQLSVNGLKV